MSFQIRFILEGGDPNGISISAEAGERLTAVAFRAGVTIQQTCGGSPSCTDCKIKVTDGINTGFEPALGAELRLMGNVYFITHERLSCQALVKGDATVLVPPPRRRTEKVFVPRRRESNEDRAGREKTSNPAYNEPVRNTQGTRSPDQRSGNRTNDRTEERHGQEKESKKNPGKKNR